MKCAYMTKTKIVCILTKEERTLFLDHAKTQQTNIRTFAETMAYTGCRISEALEITSERICKLPQNRTV